MVSDERWLPAANQALIGLRDGLISELNGAHRELHAYIDDVKALEYTIEERTRGNLDSSNTWIEDEYRGFVMDRYDIENSITCLAVRGLPQQELRLPLSPEEKVLAYEYLKTTLAPGIDNMITLHGGCLRRIETIMYLLKKEWERINTGQEFPASKLEETAVGMLYGKN